MVCSLHSVGTQKPATRKSGGFARGLQTHRSFTWSTNHEFGLSPVCATSQNAVPMVFVLVPIPAESIRQVKRALLKEYLLTLPLNVPLSGASAPLKKRELEK